MNKSELFIKGLQNDRHMDKRWILRAFALVRENRTPEELKPWDIYQSAGGFSYIDPEKGLQPISDTKAGEPMFQDITPISVKAGDFPGIKKDTETTVGRLLWHMIVFVYPFSDKVMFINERVNMGKFESTLAANFEGDPEPGEAELPDKFYPSELMRYYEGVAYARGLSMLFVPAASMKSLTIDPAVLKRRDELFNDPNIDMNNQAQAAAVEMELTKMDRDSFEGDPAARFMIKKKDFDVVRKKRFISFGSGAGLVPGSRTKYVKRSLDDGMDISMFAEYMNEMRSGSYKRGVETMFGGELDKWLVRQSSNIRMLTEDCGTRAGMPTLIDEFNQRSVLGKHIVAPKGYTTLSEDNIGDYLGKHVIIRSPAGCHGKPPDFCTICLGPRLSMNPDAISVAFSQYGNAFMGESMSAMHGKSLTIVRMDFVAEVS